MSYKVISIPWFEKELKKLVKKYPSLKKEYVELVHRLIKMPEQGAILMKNLKQTLSHFLSGYKMEN